MHSTELAPIYINSEYVERVHTFWFLCIFISADISWTENITAVIRKTQQWLHFLVVLRKLDLDCNLLLTFYHSFIKSLLTYCITAAAPWQTGPQKVIKVPQNITGCPLPFLTDIYISRCLNRAKNISKDRFHPVSDLFNLLPSGRRYRCIRKKTNRLRKFLT